MDRASDSGSEGWGFESLPVCHKNKRELLLSLIFYLHYVLNIKPVLSVIDGEIGVLGKARGSKMGNNLLVQEIDKAGGIDFNKPVLLGYSGISDALLLKYIEDSRHIWEGNLDEVRYTTVGSVIGTHAGPGAVVVAFFKQ